MALYRNDADFSLPYNRSPVVTQDGMVHTGGCIRMTPDAGCYIHSNNAHVNLGITAVQVSEGDGNLHVYLAGQYPVVSINLHTDETIGGTNGIIAGASGGTNKVVISFYDTKSGTKLNLASRTQYLKVASSHAANLWLHVLSVSQ